MVMLSAITMNQANEMMTFASAVSVIAVCALDVDMPPKIAPTPCEIGATPVENGKSPAATLKPRIRKTQTMMPKTVAST